MCLTGLFVHPCMLNMQCEYFISKDIRVNASAFKDKDKKIVQFTNYHSFLKQPNLLNRTMGGNICQIN